MDIFTCDLWGILPEEVAFTDISSFIQSSVTRKVGFRLKTVPVNTDPILVEDLLGAYNPGYKRVYLSNLTHSNGLVWVHCDAMKLIYDPEAPHISGHRDSVHYIGCKLFYVREGFEEVMSELRQGGYQEEFFNPDKHGYTLLA